MIGLNLLPDVKKEFLKAQRTRNTVISLSILAMLIAGGVTAALVLFVYVGQNAAIGLTKSSIVNKQATLASKPEIGKYLTIQNQLDALKVLHGKDTEIVYSRLFDYLLQLNPAAPNNVQLGDVKIAKDGTTVAMQGTTKSFESLEIFKNTLENASVTYKVGGTSNTTKLFTDVKLKSASLSQDSSRRGVAFEFSLVYEPNAFSPEVTNIQLSVPKLTISDAQNNAPSQIFSDSGSSN